MREVARVKEIRRKNLMAEYEEADRLGNVSMLILQAVNYDHSARVGRNL